NHPAQTSFVHRDALQVLELHHRLFARTEVADLSGEHVGSLLVNERSSVAGADRLLVFAECFLTLADHALDAPARAGEAEADQRRVRGEREGVQRLDRAALFVAVALNQANARVRARDLAGDLHTLERDGLAADGDQT